MTCERLTDGELSDLFDRLFPAGFADKDVMDKIAPDGWQTSPLRACFHPSVEQVWQEAVRMHHNVERLRQPGGPRRPEPTIENIRQEHHDRPMEPERELRELVGMCVWDVFSNNHDVIAEDRRAVDIGSFRGAAGFIADRLNAETGRDQYDYMDFYMGTIWIDDRADLTPVSELIFRRMKREGCDWRYAFPRLGLVDMRPLRDAVEQEGDASEWADYSPSKSFAEDLRRKEEDSQIEELQKDLDAAYRHEVESARKRPAPQIILAYRTVFGHDPQGWPPRS